MPRKRPWKFIRFHESETTRGVWMRGFKCKRGESVLGPNYTVDFKIVVVKF